MIFLLAIALLGSCADKKAPEASPFLKEYAGQYLIQGGVEDPKKESQRLVLSANGHAEWHRLVKDPGIGQFRLEEIKAGTWSADTTEIRLAIKGLWKNETLAFIRRDSIWEEDGRPERRITLLVSF